MERTILHADCNNYYASVECAGNPWLRDKPIAVAGDPDSRHGIVLAKNYLAKACGVATGNTLWMAKQKCPDIIFVPPHFELYVKYSNIVREIYGEYTDQVESYGLDECFLDVTGSEKIFGDGKAIADTLRDRVRSELGITISVGVSFNKVFAKLGSDMKKPDATTVIESDRFREKIWGLPVGDLLFVGRSTHTKLLLLGINTIGDLARTDCKILERQLGKNGVMLWMFANGMDTSPVASISETPPAKSIGNSVTTPRDLVTDEDVKITLYSLADCVSARLRESGFICGSVQLYVRDNKLSSFERQIALEIPNRTSKCLFDAAYKLYRRHGTCAPIRSLGIRACNLTRCENEQLSFFPEAAAIGTQETIECAVDAIRKKYGKCAIRRGILLTDRALSSASQNDDHIALPDPLF